MKRSATVLRLLPLITTSILACAANACSGDDNNGNPGSPDGSVDATANDARSPEASSGDANDSGNSDSGDGGTSSDDGGDGGASLASINHFVVVYMENHSFDNLYGEFPGADGLVGLDAGAPNVQQLDGYDGGPYAFLPLPLQADGGVWPGFEDASLPNAPFAIDDYVAPDAETRDLHHIFFTEQFQIADGGMNQFVYWSDARGLTMGHYHTMNLPVPNEAKNWTVCDHFHHAAFGGSFLNHQFLIAASAPVWNSGDAGDGKPVPASLLDNPATLQPGQNEVAVWQDPQSGTYYVVNTAFSTNSPHPYFSVPAANTVPNLTNPNIGDRLTAANLDWAWYAGGWNDAVAYSADAGVPEGGVPPTVELFQYHHQPFVYFANYADGQPGRSHLKDEQDFLAAAAAGTLPAVSFVKPVGIDNEHPGYTDVLDGDNHLLNLIKAVQNGPNWKDTAIIITYDEHGGFWDHVPPPAGDKWGPGSRVPTIVVSPFAKKGFVDHTVYDTTSILATLEKRFGLQPLADKDKNAAPLLAPFGFTQ
jgi:phospholipase C